MRGRKPIPTIVKLLNGNPGKRSLNKNEPVGKETLVDCPDWFDSQHKKLWVYAIQSAPAGVLFKIDREVLTIWVVSAVIHAGAVQMLAKVDVRNSLKLLTKNSAGIPIANPYLSIISKHALVMLRAAAELGFTPSSRSRVSVKSADETNEFINY